MTAQLVGAGRAHADRIAGADDRPRDGQPVDEADLTLGRPAVVADFDGHWRETRTQTWTVHPLAEIIPAAL